MSVSVSRGDDLVHDADARPAAAAAAADGSCVGRSLRDVVVVTWR